MMYGGTESAITSLGLAGFCKAKALSTKFNTEPLKASIKSRRDGFIMGEGVAMLVLESLEHAIKREVLLVPRDFIPLVICTH